MIDRVALATYRTPCAVSVAQSNSERRKLSLVLAMLKLAVIAERSLLLMARMTNPAHVAMQMRKANQALAELAAQQKAVALGASAKARYREAQVKSANECLHRLELSSLEDLQQEIAAMQQQLEIDEQVHEVAAPVIALIWTDLCQSGN